MAIEIRIVQRATGRLCWDCEKAIKRGDKIVIHPSFSGLKARYHFDCWKGRNQKRVDTALALLSDVERAKCARDAGMEGGSGE